MPSIGGVRESGKHLLVRGEPGAALETAPAPNGNPGTTWGSLLENLSAPSAVGAGAEHVGIPSIVSAVNRASGAQPTPDVLSGVTPAPASAEELFLRTAARQDLDRSLQMFPVQVGVTFGHANGLVAEKFGDRPQRHSRHGQAGGEMCADNRANGSPRSRPPSRRPRTIAARPAARRA